MEAHDAAQLRSIDAVLSSWRQGDWVLGEQSFLYRLDPQVPVTVDAIAAAASGEELAETEVFGFMVATQSCDLARPCDRRPYVEVCPLVQVDEEYLHSIKRGRRPNYAFLPTLADRRLVADLDRLMTVEKPVLATWDRVEGCRSDTERRSLSRALARKRSRAAFPEDFTRLAQRLRGRLIEKHGKKSEEGEALRALREIRVRAAPYWDADTVHLMLWYIRHEGKPSKSGKPFHELLKGWLLLLEPRGRFKQVQGAVMSLDDMTATDYIESDALDLDHLSTPSTGAAEMQ